VAQSGPFVGDAVGIGVFVGIDVDEGSMGVLVGIEVGI
jgi:hypothetical protein